MEVCIAPGLSIEGQRFPALQENSFRLEESIYKYFLFGTFEGDDFVKFPKLGEILVHWRVVSKCCSVGVGGD